MLKKFVLTVSLGAILATLTASTLSAHAIPATYQDTADGVVSITGNGSTLLDVAVYDERGNLIIHYSGYSPYVSFHPYWVQGIVIKVRNLGGVSNTFSMRTN